MSELIKVVDGGEFDEKWCDLCITLDTYENIDCENYDKQLHDLFENHSFEFDLTKHEYWDIA